jgi:hypothetical protein
MQLPTIAETSLRIAVFAIGILNALGYFWAFGVLTGTEKSLWIIQIATLIIGGLLSKKRTINKNLRQLLIFFGLIGLTYALNGLLNSFTSPFGLNVSPHVLRSLASLFVVFYFYSFKTK